MFIKILKINIILLFLCTFGFAESIVNIEVDGNKRISKESIIVFGKITTKTKYSDADLNQVLKNLYETDFFKAVNLSIDKNTLKITVIENPIIEELEINGIKSKKLTEMLLDQIELKSRKSYIETTFIKDLNLIKNIIKASGYYFATIKTSSVTNEVQNSIKLIYDIELGKKAKIDKIVFLVIKKLKIENLKI